MEPIQGVQTTVSTDKKEVSTENIDKKDVSSEKRSKFPSVDQEIVFPSVVEKKSQVDALRKEIQDNFGGLVFRRVKKAIAVPQNYLFTTISEPKEDGNVQTKHYKAGESPEFTEEQMKRNVAEHYKDFSIFTGEAKIRKENDKVIGEIYGHSSNYADFDLLTFTFHPMARTVKPREGDLVCGLVEYDRAGNASYSLWFVCSEQFLRFWTLLMFDSHESYYKILEKNCKEKISRKKKVDEDELRRKILSGNHLMTSGYRKWLLSCSQTLIDGKRIRSTFEELQERFWLHRAESASIHVHVYTALILLFRYYELPSENNVPNNINNGPFMAEWDLPEGWIVSLCKTNGIYPQYYTRLASYPILVTSPPKGTEYVPFDDVKALGEFDDEVFIPEQFNEDD